MTKRHELNAIACQQIVLQNLRERPFLRAPVVKVDSKWLTMRGILVSGGIFELKVDRYTREGIDSPKITPCDPAILPNEIISDFSQSTRGNHRTVPR